MSEVPLYMTRHPGGLSVLPRGITRRVGACTARDQKSAYFKCWIVPFVLVMQTTPQYTGGVVTKRLKGGGHVGLL